MLRHDQIKTSYRFNNLCPSPAWWLLQGGQTRSHPELGRQTPQRQWYYVSRPGRVGRRQACQVQRILSTHANQKGALQIAPFRPSRFTPTPMRPQDTTMNGFVAALLAMTSQNSPHKLTRGGAA